MKFSEDANRWARMRPHFVVRTNDRPAKQQLKETLAVCTRGGASEWWALSDLNGRPFGCKPNALTAELSAHPAFHRTRRGKKRQRTVRFPMRSSVCHDREAAEQSTNLLWPRSE